MLKNNAHNYVRSLSLTYCLCQGYKIIIIIIYFMNHVCLWLSLSFIYFCAISTFDNISYAKQRIKAIKQSILNCIWQPANIPVC